MSSFITLFSSEGQLAPRTSVIPFPETIVRDVVVRVCRQSGYPSAVPDGTRFLSVSREGPKGRTTDGSKSTLQVEWAPASPGTTRFEFGIYDDSNSYHRIFNVVATQNFGLLLEKEFRRLPAAPPGGQVRANDSGEVLVGPGERLSEDDLHYIEHPDSILYYSGCASAGQLSDFFNGKFTLGRYVQFGKNKPVPTPGPRLFLEELGASIVGGAAGSGKTSLLARWQTSARRAGYTVLILDPRGDLLAKAGRGMSDDSCFFFSTSDHDDQSDTLNLLPSHHHRNHIEAFVRLLLPEESREVQQRASVLIHLVGIYAERFPDQFELHPADVSHLQALANDERLFSEWMTLLLHADDSGDERHQALAREGGNWLARICDALKSDLFPDRGRRPPNQTYFDHMGQIERAAASLICGERSGRTFNLQQILTSAKPLVAGLEIVPEDHDHFELMPALIREDLHRALDERTRLLKRGASLPPVLILVDECRHFPHVGASAVSVWARQTKVHCAVSLSTLDELGVESGQSDEVLERANLVCLGSVAGSLFESVKRRLRERRRQSVTRSTRRASDGPHRELTLTEAPGDYFTKQELESLPAGKRPALVIAGATKLKRPILTDFAE